MPPFLMSLIQIILPFLLNEAEKIFSRGLEKSGPLKHEWVTNMCMGYIPVLEAHLPDFLKPDAALLARAISEAIEKGLVELGL